MKLWSISDLHLSFGDASCSWVTKPMHIFGEHWRKHWLKISAVWEERIQPQDVILLPGDLSWARTTKNARHDLLWLAQRRGVRKIIVPGNHDHWWPPNSTLPQKLHSLQLLRGTALAYQGMAFCGTCGWIAPQDPYAKAHDSSPFEEELALLEKALKAAKKLQPIHGIHVLLHFSPWDSQGKPTPFDKLLQQYQVSSITYGHFHFPQEWELAPKGWHNGIFYTLASADFLQFTPTPLPFPC